MNETNEISFAATLDQTVSTELLADRLVQSLSTIGPCVIAFSGGVDSSVVAAAAYRAVGENCVAVTGLGSAVSQLDRSFATEVAKSIGLRHEFLPTNEIDSESYRRNDGQRCFYCKDELYNQIRIFAQKYQIDAIVSGTNFDDLGDYRPGLLAGENHRVLTPLASLGIRKDQVRGIAKLWNLSVAERPAAPCLSSRIAYGVEVTKARLQMVERGENLLHDLGFTNVRVRLHDAELARIEIPAESLKSFFAIVDLQTLASDLKLLGFRFVTVDLSGLKSGSLNQMLPILSHG